MDVYEAIMHRRSVRQYEDREIPEELLIKVIEAGLQAPSAVNYQPWYIVAVKDPEEMKRLKETMSDVSEKILPELEDRFSKHPEVIRSTTSFLGTLGGAPVCFLIFVLKPDYPKKESIVIQSVAAAIENMVIAAEGEGLGTCWITAALETGAGVRLREQYAPDKGEFVAALTMGYPRSIPKAPPRKSGRYKIL